jgi:hypothetical protein
MECGYKEVEFQFQFLGFELVRFTSRMNNVPACALKVCSFQLYTCFLCKMPFMSDNKRNIVTNIYHLPQACGHRRIQHC